MVGMARQNKTNISSTTDIVLGSWAHWNHTLTGRPEPYDVSWRWTRWERLQISILAARKLWRCCSVAGPYLGTSWLTITADAPVARATQAAASSSNPYLLHTPDTSKLQAISGSPVSTSFYICDITIMSTALAKQPSPSRDRTRSRHGPSRDASASSQSNSIQRAKMITPLLLEMTLSMYMPCPWSRILKMRGYFTTTL